MGAFFGEYIRKKRLSLQAENPGFSIRSLAKRIGVHHSYLSKIERGESATLSERKLVALAMELGEDPDLFLAMSGKISEKVQKAVQKQPALFSSLVRNLSGAQPSGIVPEAYTRGVEHRRLQMLLDHCPQHIFFLNGRGDMELANGPCVRHFDIEPESLSKQPLSQIIPTSLARQMKQAADQVLQSRSSLCTHLPFTNKGLARLYRATLSPVLDDAGKIQEICVVGDELSQAPVRSQEREQEAILRHNLRAPLCSLITGVKALLHQGPLTDSQREILLEMHKVQERLLAYMDISYDLDKIAKGEVKPIIGPVNLLPVVFDAVGQCRGMVQNKDVAASIKLNGAAPVDGDCFHVLADDKLCFLLMVNLITNALEASPTGGSVDISLEAPGTVHIHNSGAVPENIRDTFFEKYATSGKCNGTGLGTYIAWQLTHAMNGALSMSTSPELGTTLTLRLKPAP